MEYKVLKKQYRAKMCFVCGSDNQSGLNTHYYVLEHKRLLGIFRGSDIHQSYPMRMHGGIISALLDETIGRSVQIDEPHTWGVTVELHVRFLKPVPLGETLHVVGWMGRNRRLLYEGEGYICSVKGEILATATAKYMRQKAEQIIDVTRLEEPWGPIETDADIERIELPK